MKVSVTTLIGVAGLAASLTLGACAVNSAGTETIFGVSTGISAANVALVQTDVQAAVAALPSICTDFANAATMTNAEIALLASQTKLPARTVSNISAASAKGLLLCNGTAAIVAPAAAAPAGTPPTATP